ncbi:MAG: YsnF/AvaK domain-containing protein [Chloroflexota bacterium]
MKTEEMQVQPGASVDAIDGRLGTVDEVVVRPQTGELAYLVVRRGWSDRRLTIGAELVAAISSPKEVRLRVTRTQAQEMAVSIPTGEVLGRAGEHEIRVPVLEERLVPGKRAVDMGELRIHKYVDSVEETVRQPVTRDDLVVERVPVNRPLEAPVGSRMEGDWLVIPVMEEVLVIQKRLMLKEEVRIRKQQVTEEQEVHETVRHERVEIEDATVRGVTGLDRLERLERPTLNTTDATGATDGRTADAARAGIASEAMPTSGDA